MAGRLGFDGHVFREGKYLLVLFFPCLLYFVLFVYRPMWGVLIAFKNYKDMLGFSGSAWVGLKYFRLFLESPDAYKIIRNTFLLGLYGLLWGFPFPILFALVLNDVQNAVVRKFVQTVSYLPYFISQVVVVGMVLSFLSPTSGVVNDAIRALGGKPVVFMSDSSWFRTIYIASDIWQHMGWTAIIYIAALANIDVQLYDAARIDGCSRLRIIRHVDLPGIAPTIIVMFLLNTGRMLNVGFEKVLLMYNPAIYETADIVSTYVYRQGLGFGNYSYATAIDLFQSGISLVFIVACNALARRYSETSLW